MGKKILIVDDSEFMRMKIKDIITALGFEVAGEAENGAQALEKFSTLKPDLVTMDLVMPECTGLEGLKLIREKDKNAKVIMVSAVDQKETLAEAIRLGALDFIVKPFEDEFISSTIKRALET